MAYMNQEKKAKIAPNVKSVLKKYGVKGTLSVCNRVTLVMTVTQGPIDFIANFNEVNADKIVNKVCGKAVDSLNVNPYWYHEHFSGKALSFLKELLPAMNAGNHDNSDVQTDYFDVGWYVDVNIGRWNKPYRVV